MPELKPARLRLLELAAKIARREYLPDLDTARTIRDARAITNYYADKHGQLAMQLKAVWDELQ